MIKFWTIVICDRDNSFVIPRRVQGSTDVWVEEWQRRIQNLVRYLRWGFMRKQLTAGSRTLFLKKDIWQGSEYATELKKVKELPQNEMKFNWYHIFYSLSLSIDFRIGMSGWFNEERKKILKMNFVLLRMKVYKNEFSFGVNLVFSIFYISRVIITFQSYLQRNNK